MRTVIVEPVGVSSPLPLVVFAEGYDQTPEAYVALLDAWAAAGYLVVAPDLPGLASDLPGTPVENDTANEAVDLSFVIGSMESHYPGLVDPSHIAVAGHSDGGMAVVTLALDSQFADPRVSAYLAMSSQIPEDVQANWGAQPMAGDLMVSVGSNDEYQNYPLSVQVFQTANMPKVMVTVPGGDHLGIYLDSSTVAQAVRAATVAFLNSVLRAGGTSPDGQQLAAMLSGLPNAGSYTVQGG